MQYRFSDYMLDIARRELRKDGIRTPVEPQVFDLLAYLIQNRDRVVTKDDLIGSVWGGRIVSESTLTSRINAARRALGDNGQAQKVIRTAARKGIRFVADVMEVPPPEVLATLQAPRDRPSIAVMPFRNLTGSSSQDYFVDGMVEELVTGLSRIKWLFVIARDSTLIYRDRGTDVRTFGRELGVRYILEGSVRRSGSDVRITAQLSETETGTSVWADRYDGEIGEVFALQDQLTMRVIGAVDPNLRKAEVERARRKRPENIDAYDLFLRALPLATTAMPEDAAKALTLLEQALVLEPGYAIVHGLIAWCHEQRYLRGGLHAETQAAALQHAQAAIEAGGDDAMALAMGGFTIAVVQRDYRTAIDTLNRAISLSPSSALAFGFSSIVRAWIGDDETAIKHAEMGIRLSPYDPMIYLPNVGLSFAQFFSEKFEEAASAASRASAANPKFSVFRYLHTAALIRLGKPDEAKSAASILVALQPSFTISAVVAGKITTPERLAVLATALREAGLPE